MRREIDIRTNPWAIFEHWANESFKSTHKWKLDACDRISCNIWPHPELLFTLKVMRRPKQSPSIGYHVGHFANGRIIVSSTLQFRLVNIYQTIEFHSPHEMRMNGVKRCVRMVSRPLVMRPHTKFEYSMKPKDSTSRISTKMWHFFVHILESVERPAWMKSSK